MKTSERNERFGFPELESALANVALVRRFVQSETKHQAPYDRYLGFMKGGLSSKVWCLHLDHSEIS